MSHVDIESAAPDLRALVERARSGEGVVLIDRGQDVARIVPSVVASPDRPFRRLGLAAGLFTVPDDFDAPLPDDVLESFHGAIAP